MSHSTNPSPSDIFTSSSSAARSVSATSRETQRAADRIVLIETATPVERLARLTTALGGGPDLFVKRDDAIAFGGGGNKVRKLEFVARAAGEHGADTLITTGGAQSNHARVTAAAAARLGMACHLVLSGERPARARGNLQLMELFGATIEYVSSRGDREAAMSRAADRLRGEGRTPFVIPLGASTPVGALGLIRAAQELCAQMEPPDFIVHASSSGGRQAGLVAGCLLAGARTRVIGISADESAPVLEEAVARLIEGIRDLLGDAAGALDCPPLIEVDDRFVGAGYGVPTDASRAAQQMVAQLEALVLDPTYTAKAMAALMSYIREGRFSHTDRVVFWHTGGVPALFV